MTDIDLLVTAIHNLSAVRPSSDPAWSRPAASKVIDCVLSLRRRYDSFVVPRLESFERSHPGVRSVQDLRSLIDSYPSPGSFMEQVLNYRDPARSRTLAGVVGYLIGILEQQSGRSEDEGLARWASKARPADYQGVGIRGFGLAGYQYLRMLFGADTTKPDVHICRFVRNALHRRVSDVAALDLLESAASVAGVKVRDLDTTIWEASARQTIDTEGAA